MKKKSILSCFLHESEGNLLKKMKLLVVFFFTGLISVSASTYSQQTKLNLKLDEVTVKEAFKQIEESSEFVFFYNEDYIDVNQKVSINVKNENIETILVELLKGTKNPYKIYDRQIVILSPEMQELPQIMKSETKPEQKQPISGKVTDSSGRPLPGVSIVVMGTTTGSITDANGNYSIFNIPENATLQFSFIGMKTQEVLVGENTTINVTLAEDTFGFEEVVAIGYGTTTKREMVGSISKIEAKDIASKQVSSFETAMQGQAAGVNVTSGSGMAGSGSLVRIRGISSINATGDPLYVVDGIPITQNIFGLNATTWGMNPNPLSAINPNDIESIEILKDAAACGIYGSRGSNGVILITTKKATDSKLKINFSSKSSLCTAAKDPNVVGGKDWMQMYQEAWENDGHTGTPQNLPGGLTWEQAKINNTNWWDLITQVGFKQEYNLASSFGIGEKVKAYVSGSYSDNESYIKRNAFERYSGNINLNYTPNKKLSFSLSSMLANAKTDLVGDPWSGGTGAALGTALPIYPIFNDDGTYFKGGGNDGNPVMVSNLQDVFNNELRTINSLSINIKPTNKLSFAINGAVDYLNFVNDGHVDKYLRSVNGDYQWQAQTDVLNYNYNVVGSYNLSVNENDFTFLLGNEMQNSKTTGIRDEYDYDPASTNANNHITYPEQEWRFLSFFGRLNYKFKDRYIAQASLRYDGSSRFGANNKFGSFPTLAIGWIASEEPVFKELINDNFISFLKFKASYGYTGNSDIPNYEHLGTYVTPTSTSSFYNDMPVRYPYRYSNPDLKWEITKSLDVAAEVKFFNGRIAVEAAYYSKISEDVFINVNISRTTGYGDQWQNLATILNEGFEFDLTTRNIVGKQIHDFKWTTRFNIATLNNEVTDLGGLTSEEIGGGANDTRILLGYPIATMRMVRFSRIDPADGRPIYLDKEGNETKTYIFSGENGYAMPSGKLMPDFTGGLTNTFEYKGFSLSGLLIFSSGASLYDAGAKRQMTYMSNWNFRTDGFDRWQEPGDIAKYPRLTLDGINWGAQEQWFNTSMWVYPASYLRLKYLTFAYEIPDRFLEKWHVSGAKISLSGTNLFTLTDFPGIDPEVARDFNDARDRNMSPNATYLTVPQEKVYTLGLNVSF